MTVSSITAAQTPVTINCGAQRKRLVNMLEYYFGVLVKEFIRDTTRCTDSGETVTATIKGRWIAQ
jgi:hypothetical protein